MKQYFSLIDFHAKARNFPHEKGQPAIAATPLTHGFHVLNLGMTYKKYNIKVAKHVVFKMFDVCTLASADYRTDAQTFASKQLVFVFHLNFSRMVHFSFRVQLHFECMVTKKTQTTKSK